MISGHKMLPLQPSPQAASATKTRGRRTTQQINMFTINYLLTITISAMIALQYNLINVDVEAASATVTAATAAATEGVAPSNIGQQQPQLQTVTTSIINNNNNKHSYQSNQLARLPKINIFLGRNETKRLLGIDTKINYVSEGNINTYPLGFTIPLGYNQSDMMFTWQNLDRTNVNYSIWFTLSNLEPVNIPIINITRKGMIPREEEVFRVTLPCSGRSTSEVDVDFFINITGFVPMEATTDSGQLLTSIGQDGESLLAADDDDDGLVDSTLAAAASAAAATTGGDQDIDSTTTTATTNSASASANSSNAAAATTGDEIQSDQEDLPRIVMVPVSHTLVIKRKKICTMHPVPVQPNTFPPTQPTQRPVLAAAGPANKWPAAAQQSQSQPAAYQVVTTQTTAAHRQQSSASEPISSSSSRIAGGQSELSLRDLQQSDPAKPHHLSIATPASFPQAPARVRQHDQFPAQWPPFPPPGPTIPKIAPENPLNEILANRHHNSQLSSGQQQQQQNHNNNQQQQQQSFMVPVLALLSVLISLALIVVVLLAALGSSSSSGTSTSAPASFLLNKLNSLKSCRLLRRAKGAPALARASNAHHHHHTIGSKSHHHHQLPTSHAAMINSLRAGLKSSASSSVSGLSATSGHSHLTGGKQQQYCSNSSSSNGYKTYNYNSSSPYYGQSFMTSAPPHYHHPPTADLLGTGYQCQQQQQQQQPPPQYPIYHIESTTANPNQTTRLIWQNGNGTSPDGFTMDGSYMPLSNSHAPSRSDDNNSCAYQTIY